VTGAQLHVRPAVSGATTKIGDPSPAFAYRAGLALLFAQFSMAHEIAGHFLGARLYIMWVLIPLAVGAMCLTNGLGRALGNRAVLCWIGFTLWAIACIPFSTWPGGSVETMIAWFKGAIGTVVVYAGVFTTWPQMRTALYIIAAALPINILTARMFAREDVRLALEFGTLGNANDFAAHLLLIISIALFVAFRRKGLVRLAILGVASVALYMAFATGSRGALVAVAAAAALYVIRAPMRQRVATMVLAPIAAVIVFAVLPDDIKIRLLSFGSGPGVDTGARDSQQTREYLFWKSIEHTVANPLFGVGPGQFGVYEGKQKIERGGSGAWFSTHNSFTQISSECGIPALLFYCGALFLTWRMLTRVWREAAQLGMADISAAALWMSIGFAAFTTAALFLNVGYLFHFPTLTGLSIGLSTAFTREKALMSGVRPRPDTDAGRSLAAPVPTRLRFQGSDRAHAGTSNSSGSPGRGLRNR
jgi:O-antigen ligase